MEENKSLTVAFFTEYSNLKSKVVEESGIEEENWKFEQVKLLDDTFEQSKNSINKKVLSFIKNRIKDLFLEIGYKDLQGLYDEVMQRTDGGKVALTQAEASELYNRARIIKTELDNRKIVSTLDVSTAREARRKNTINKNKPGSVIYKISENMEKYLDCLDLAEKIRVRAFAGCSNKKRWGSGI